MAIDDDMNDLDTPVDEKLLSGEDETEPEVKEPEAKAEPEPEAPAEEPAAEVKAEPRAEERDKQIPRARFDEVNAKLHEERETRERVEAELAALKASPAPDIAAMEKEYTTALMSGEEDKAAEIRAKINSELIRQATEAAFAKTDQIMTQRESERAFKAAVAQTLKDYPFLDSTTGNPEAIAEVVEWRDFYISKGHPAHEALVKAAERVAPAYVEKEEPAPPSNVTKIDPRNAKAVARGAAAAKAQPAAPVAGVGNRAVPADVIPEKQEDWEKLPEKERERLLS